MANSTIWWLIAGGAIVLELLSGTVYLLLLSAGFASAAIAAHLGAGMTTQLLVAAVVGVGAVMIWHGIRRNRPAEPSSGSNPDVNLDVGEKCSWTPGIPMAPRPFGTAAPNGPSCLAPAMRHRRASIGWRKWSAAGSWST
jgi:hypothetical protein